MLDPPSFEPGTYCGAGKLWIDEETKEYWLTSRPRQGETTRGYAIEIYRSKNGEDYSLMSRVTKEELSDISKVRVQSIENQQLLLDPLTGKYFLYVSVDVAERNIAGIAGRILESKWETYLMTADDPSGPWRGNGFVLRGDMEYDSAEARDSTIDIVDGRYVALYKARRLGDRTVHTALALSPDGVNWTKLGILKIDNRSQPEYFLLNGTIHSGCGGPVFVGTKTIDVVNGSALTKYFAAHYIDIRRLNLETIFEASWLSGSRYEHKDYPIHTYSNVVYDPTDYIWLIWIEAIDPIHSRGLGLNQEVHRVLLYRTEPCAGR